jgi:hypothetical protein
MRVVFSRPGQRGELCASSSAALGSDASCASHRWTLHMRLATERTEG